MSLTYVGWFRHNGHFRSLLASLDRTGVLTSHNSLVFRHKSTKMALPRVYFDMQADGQNLGRVVMEVLIKFIYYYHLNKNILVTNPSPARGLESESLFSHFSFYLHTAYSIYYFITITCIVINLLIYNFNVSMCQHLLKRPLNGLTYILMS